MMRGAVLAMAAAAVGAASVGRPPRDVMVIAHRGASWDAPEHTFAAYDLALRLGAVWIEQDLQMTRDGELVVFHDDTLGRTARGPAASCTGFVRARTLAELRRCDVGRWFNEANPARARRAYRGQRIPTLDAVLVRYRERARFYIETKSPGEAPGMEVALVASLRRHRLYGEAADTGRVIAQSFSAASLLRLHALAPGLPLVQLIDEAIPAATVEATLDSIARYATGIGPSRRIITAQLVQAAQARGLVVHPYTVNEPATMDFLLRLGVDGMFTDRPDLLRARLSR